MKTSAKFFVISSFIVVLGTLIVPLSSYAEEEHEIAGAVKVSFGIAESLSMKVTGGGHIEDEDKTFLSMANGSIETVEHGIEVSTNNTNGYTLSLRDSDDNNNLTREDGAYDIPAVVNSLGENDELMGAELVQGQSGWGYDVKRPIEETDYSGVYLAVPVNNEAVIYNHSEKITTTKANFSEIIYVRYGISAGNSRAGVYEDTIRYQVTGNLVPDHLATNPEEDE